MILRIGNILKNWTVILLLRCRPEPIRCFPVLAFKFELRTVSSGDLVLMYRVVNNVRLKFSLGHVGLKCFSLKEENTNVSKWLVL